jgi:transposase-like protein
MKRTAGKPRILTPEQAAEVCRRYHEGKRNRPTALAREYGMSISTLVEYVRRQAREHRA